MKDHCDDLLVGNGICNDQVNTLDCSFDGNDCCLQVINNLECTECLCHLDQTRHESSKSKIETIVRLIVMKMHAFKGCQLEKLGDGVCHDECSLFPWVFFDELDCCQDFIDDSVCADCICVVGFTRQPSSNTFLISVDYCIHN